MASLCGSVRFDGGIVDRRRLERMAAAALCPGTPVIEVVADGGVGLAVANSGLEPAAQLRRQGPVAVALAARLDGAGEGETAADTLLRARQEAGNPWPQRLTGAFAAALWDGRSATLELVRDRVGERPLYWRRLPGGFDFASDPVQLVAGGASAEPDRRRLLAYLLGDLHVDPSWSFFAGIERLPEGHRLTATSAGIEVRAWWSWQEAAAAEPRRSRPEAAAELRRRLAAAVERRLPVVGETGVLLSGGLDSSSVAALAAPRLAAAGRRVHAFTWASASGDGLDERQRSSQLLATLPNAVEHPIAADDLWPLSRHPEAYADPNAPHTNAYPDLLLTTLETAREHGVTTLMNGLGGDPVVGWWQSDLALLAHGRLLGLARRWRRQGGLASLKNLVRTLRSVPTPSWLTTEARRLARHHGFDRPPLSLARQADSVEVRRFCLTSPVNAATLERLDRLSRRAGVRLEAPWHDPELGSLTLSLPDGALDQAPPGKSLLRHAVRDCLPVAWLDPAPGAEPVLRLRMKGLEDLGRPVVERLLQHSRLAELGLVDGERFVASYSRRGPARGKVPNLWLSLTCEMWLRNAPI